MYLVQFLLPVSTNDGQPFAASAFERVRTELTERFGGVTAYLRSPAVGAWQDDEGCVAHDDMICVEVMCDTLDRSFWTRYRAELAQRFSQRELLVRALACEAL
jgi:hypothetical protein